jgi:hypothetical protein
MELVYYRDPENSANRAQALAPLGNPTVSGLTCQVSREQRNSGGVRGRQSHLASGADKAYMFGI